MTLRFIEPSTFNSAAQTEPVRRDRLLSTTAVTESVASVEFSIPEKGKYFLEIDRAVPRSTTGNFLSMRVLENGVARTSDYGNTIAGGDSVYRGAQFSVEEFRFSTGTGSTFTQSLRLEIDINEDSIIYSGISFDPQNSGPTQICSGYLGVVDVTSIQLASGNSFHGDIQGGTFKLYRREDV